jgi:hypothetical protein
MLGQGQKRINDLSGVRTMRISIEQKNRDNPHSDRFIEVGTKALRRELMSGETLRAPRQQLRRLRASAFDLFRESVILLRRAFRARFLFVVD